MQFSFTSEQEEFRSVLRRFLEEKSPPAVVRRLMETEAGWQRESWRELNQQLGLTAVHIPEGYGGQGFGPVELGIVLEEMGRALVCAPYFSSTVLAATAIMNAGSDPQKRALLPSIAAGDTTATLAFTEPNGRWNTAGIEARATGATGKLSSTARTARSSSAAPASSPATTRIPSPPAGRSPRMAGCTPETSASWTRMAMSRSPTARRTSSSRQAARTSRRARSRTG